MTSELSLLGVVQSANKKWTEWTPADESSKEAHLTNLMVVPNGPRGYRINENDTNTMFVWKDGALYLFDHKVPVLNIDFRRTEDMWAQKVAQDRNAVKPNIAGLGNIDLSDFVTAFLKQVYGMHLHHYGATNSNGELIQKALRVKVEANLDIQKALNNMH